MNKKINIGIAGCGWIAENAYIPCITRFNNVVIKSLYDVNINRVNELSDKYNIENRFNKYNKFIKSGLDAVIILTPNHTHSTYCKEALENKLHVLCEKPTTIYENEMIDIIKIAKKNELIFFPAFTNKFRKDIMKIIDIIKSNDIGNIMSIDAGWLRSSGVPKPGSWFTNKNLSGGGVLIDLGPHVIDICNSIMDYNYINSININEINKIQNCNGCAKWFSSSSSENHKVDVEDSIDVQLIFENKKELNIKLSWDCEVTEDVTYFHILGDTGELHYETLFGFSNNRSSYSKMYIIKDERRFDIEVDNRCNLALLAFYDMIECFISNVCNNNYDNDMVKNSVKTVKIIDKIYTIIDKEDIQI